MDHIPAEILEEMFWLAIPPFKTKTRTALAFVCKEWMEVISCSPRLWATIDSDYPPAFTELVLEKSQDHPLHFRFQYGKSKSFEKICSLIKDYSHRCRSITHIDYRPFPATLSERQLPNLREIILLCDVYWQSKLPLPQFYLPSPYIPVLHLLTLRGYLVVPLSERPAWGLRHLELGSTKLALSKFLVILEANPLLQTLILAHVYVMVDCKRRPIALPALRELRISFPGWGSPQKTILHLLQVVRLISIGDIRTIHLAQLGLSPICLTAVGWISGPIRNITAGRKDIKISLHWLQVVFECPGLCIRWSVNTETMNIDFLPRFLLRFLPAGAHIHTLEVSTYNNKGDEHVEEATRGLQKQYSVESLVWNRPPGISQPKLTRADLDFLPGSYQTNV